MPVEHRIRSVGTKSVTYPWLRRYVVIGPYNRHVRRDVAASILANGFINAVERVARLRRPSRPKR